MVDRIESWMGIEALDCTNDTDRSMNDIRKDLQQAQRIHSRVLDEYRLCKNQLNVAREVYDDFMIEHQDCVARMIIDEIQLLIDKG